jgi:hypothetical protein
MLWYKGWRETRIRLLIAVVMMAFYLTAFHFIQATAPPPGAKPAAAFALGATIFIVMFYSWLAGAGIATQAAFQATKGLHGSTLFTLSLPVSRFRLLAVRASIGWLEMSGLIAAWCCGCWLLLPVVRGSVTAMDTFEYVIALIACGSSLYYLSVLLATFLDDLWRMWGGMLAFGGLWLLSNYARLPVSVNIVRAMLGESSPLLAHTMPWATMAFSLGLAAVLFFTALKIAQAREY